MNEVEQLKNILQMIDLRRDKPLLLAIIMLSALSVVSILFYVRVVFVTPLKVNGATVGSPNGGFSSAVIGMIVFSVFVLSITVSVFLRELRRHFRKTVMEESTDSKSLVPTSEELEEFLKEKKDEQDDFVAHSG
jgi:hypothetical protein